MTNGSLAFVADISQVVSLVHGRSVQGVVAPKKRELRYLQLIVSVGVARKLAGIAGGSKRIQPLPSAEDSKTFFREGPTYSLHLPHCATFDPLIRNLRPESIELDPILA